MPPTPLEEGKGFIKVANITPFAPQFVPITLSQAELRDPSMVAAANLRLMNQLVSFFEQFAAKRREDLTLDELLDGFGRQHNSMYRTIDFKMDLARNDEEVGMSGGFFMFIEELTNDPNAQISVRFEQRQNDQINFKQGTSIATPFHRYYLTHTAQAGKTARLLISPERKNVADFNAPSAQSLSSINSLLGGTSDNYKNITIGVAQSQIYAASAVRREVLIYNNGTVPIFVGQDASVTTANGLPIPAGAFYTLTYRGALHAISGTAGQDVRTWSIV